MNTIDHNKLFNDIKYQTLHYEYVSFVKYIIEVIHDNSCYLTKLPSASVRFNNKSVVFEIKNELYNMIQNTFSEPQFVVTEESYENNPNDLCEDEYSITVSWH
jgi:hypothetical protein